MIARADDDEHEMGDDKGAFSSRTAQLDLRAFRNEVRDGFLTAKGICITDATCLAEPRQAPVEDKELRGVGLLLEVSVDTGDIVELVG